MWVAWGLHPSLTVASASGARFDGMEQTQRPSLAHRRRPEFPLRVQALPQHVPLRES